MKESEKTMKRLSTTKTVLGIIFSIAILLVAQIFALAISEIPLGMGIPGSICNIIAGILYTALTLAGAGLLCKKFLKIPLIEMRIPRFQLNSIWVVVAILMPALVLLFSMMTGGHWAISAFSREETLATITSAVVFYGFATGIVEEVVFRGLIMGCLEKRFQIKIAIIIPSVLFGVLHIFGNSLNFISIIQLLIAGSIVGVLFSLIAYTSNSIWNSAVVHGVWNMTIIGGILYIGDRVDSGSIFNFVLGNKMFLLSGGDFGIEASVISIFVYLIFCILAVVILKKDKIGKQSD